MTQTTTTTAAPLDAAERPGPDTPVLLNRQLRPGTQPSQLSRFGDDRWNLTPAIFEGHLQSVSLNFTLVPAAFRDIAKRYAWLELNHEDPLILRRASINGRLAVYTMLSHMRNIRAFLDWLDLHGITSLGAVTDTDLQHYLDHVRDAEIRRGARSDLLQAVRRLWAFRDMLPADARLPEAPPWNGKDTRILLGRPQRNREDRTPRIPEATMSMMLSWALRMIDDFSADILRACAEWAHLYTCTWTRRHGHRAAGSKTARPHLIAVLDRYRQAGRPLPGGPVGLCYSHLAREVDVARTTLNLCASNRSLVEQAAVDLGVDDDSYLWTPLTA
jgi:hypothetical protein